MEKRKLGDRGLEVFALGFGCMGLSFPNAPAKEEKIVVIATKFGFKDGNHYFVVCK